VPGEPLSLDEAVDLTRTGDVWIFRGRTAADRAIQSLTNSPVNHVGMAVVLDDLPPLMWHAELGRSLPDLWSGKHQRGVQLHDLSAAVRVWGVRYGQRAWLRQLDPPVNREMEDAVLRTIARLDGAPFPSTAQLAWRWLRGRVPAPLSRVPTVPAPLRRDKPLRRPVPSRSAAPSRGAAPSGSDAADSRARDELETVYCAEVVAMTYEAMGLLSAERSPSWYDPGRFWSGDALRLQQGFRLGEEIAVTVSA
jgi:hypothetical protein